MQVPISHWYIGTLQQCSVFCIKLYLQTPLMINDKKNSLA